MARIHLTQNNSFSPIPEGIHVFRIWDVEYDETFGIVKIHLVNAKGKLHTERFTIMRADGSMIDGACNALSFFAKTALQNTELTDIDHTELIGHYIKAQVVHNVQPNKDDPSKTVTFVNLTDKWTADGFDTEPCERAMTLSAEDRKSFKTKERQEQPTDTGNVNLDSLLDQEVV